MPTEQWKDLLVGRVDLLTHFGASKNDFTTREDQKHDFGVGHPENETGEDFRVVATLDLLVLRLSMQRLEFDFEAYVMRTHDILNGEIGQLDVSVANLLQLLSIVLCCRVAVTFRLSSGTDHLARAEDESCGLRFTDAHDGSGESLRLVLDILTFQTNLP